LRILITGSNGLLGTKVLEVLLPVSGVQLVATSRDACRNAYLGTFHFASADVSDARAVRELVDDSKPEAIVHAAALTDVDGCERDPVAAFRINVEGTRNVAAAAAVHGAHLIHLSTEYVFDGTGGPYREIDLPRAISVYGRTKLAGEQITARECASWAVARTTVVYGQLAHGKPNFVLWLLSRLAAGERVRIVADQVGSPTLADNLAEMIAALALSRAPGIFHTAGRSRLSRFDFARLAAEVFGLDASLIEPVSTATLKQPAPRPLRAGLLTDRFESTFPAVRVLSAREGLLKLHGQQRDARAVPALDSSGGAL
jgi:dTDP-4-dehydrorhamnose reductase